MSNRIPEIWKKMWEKDYFSQWLGIVIEEVAIGYCKANFTIRKEMLNGHGTVQGGVLFSVADAVFAFACNAQGKVTVALEANINFTAPARLGEVLTVEAKVIHQGGKTGVYDVRVLNTQSQLVCVFKGTSYTTSKNILDDSENS